MADHPAAAVPTQAASELAELAERVTLTARRHAEEMGALAERRAALMVLRRRQGASLGQIAREARLTKQGVAWILKQHEGGDG